MNEVDHLGQTALHTAAQGGRVGVARFLLANGADQNIKTAAGQDVETVSNRDGERGREGGREGKREGYQLNDHSTCSQVATPAVVKLLQEKPACSNSDIESQLLEAGKNGDIDIVKVSLPPSLPPSFPPSQSLYTFSYPETVYS